MSDAIQWALLVGVVILCAIYTRVKGIRVWTPRAQKIVLFMIRLDIVMYGIWRIVVARMHP